VIETSLPAVARQFSEEAQIQYNGEKLRLIGGTFYFDEKGWSGGFNNVLGSAGFLTVLDEPAENISKSLFAEGNLFPDRQVQFDAGGTL